MSRIADEIEGSGILATGPQYDTTLTEGVREGASEREHAVA